MNKSQALFERSVKSIPGGVNSNSRARSPYPLYFKRGEGAYIYDVDGNVYIDMVLGNGAIFFGHGYKPFEEKYQEYLKLCPGLTTGFETELSAMAAEVFLKIVPADKVRFTNTGTEATIHVMQMARAHTGKNDFALIEGAYNGWVDGVNVSTFPGMAQVGDVNRPTSVPGYGGLDKNLVESAVVIPFNNLEITEKLIAENKDRLAALIIEPVMIDVGYIEPTKAYLDGLRAICDKYDVLLVFDELLTGFRVSGGSCMKWYDVKPDLACFGKAIANGHILAAVAGTEELMETVGSRGLTAFVGTFNGHVYSLASGLAAMELMADGSAFNELEKNSQFLINEFEKMAKKYNVEAFMCGRGGHLHWYFSSKVENYRDAASGNNDDYTKFTNALLDQNIYAIPRPLSHHAISLCHDRPVLDKIVTAMDNALQVLV